jgi:hypothetical protein
MTNINTAVRYLPGAAPNPNIHDLSEEFRRKDNASFLAYVAGQIQKVAPNPAGLSASSVAAIGLIGEYGLLGYGVRRAQEIIRLDRGPSYWSHAFLFVGEIDSDAATVRSARKAPWILESTLEPSANLNSWMLRDGVGPRRVSDYSFADFDLAVQHCVPNMAVIAFGLRDDERDAILKRAHDPAADRLHYDVPGLLGTWFAYLSNTASAPNPLSTGAAIYCSAYVQMAYDAAGIDLAPGAHQRNTSPEHIWQSAKFLSSVFKIPSRADPAKFVDRSVHCWYVIRDPACVIAPVGENLRDFSELMSG